MEQGIYRKLAEEGVSVEIELHSPFGTYFAYFDADPLGTVGWGEDAESAYLDLLERTKE